MKALVLCALVFTSSLAAQDLPDVPAERSVNLRLDMASDEMTKAGRDRITSAIVLLFGGAMVLANESQRDGAKYEEGLSWWMGGATAGAFITFQLTGGRHDKRAAKALHQ